MPAPRGGKFALIAELEEGIEMPGAFERDAAALAAVATARAAPRDEFFPAKRHTPVPSASSYDPDLRFVNEHPIVSTVLWSVKGR